MSERVDLSIFDGIAAIPIRRRNGSVVDYAIVDEADAAWLWIYTWRLSNGYACRDGARFHMHREILGLYRGNPLEGDHANRDRLDNRRANLRIVTHAENCQNVGSQGTSSRFRGVRWHPKAGKWQASVQVAGKFHHLGLFVIEEDAARVAAAFRAEHMPYAVEEAAL